jgi:hypothetical protein
MVTAGHKYWGTLIKFQKIKETIRRKEKREKKRRREGRMR